MAALDIYVGDTRLERRELPAGPLRVGRAAGDGGWSLPELVDLSAQHLELRPDPLRVADLGSKNGTRVNGVAVVGEVELRDGDEISAGSARLVVRLAGPLDWAVDQLPALVDAGTIPERLRLVVREARALAGAEVAWALQWDGPASAPRHRILVHEGGESAVPDPGLVPSSIVGRAAARGRAVWTEDASADVRFRDRASVRSLRLRAAGAVPLGSAGALYLAGDRPVAEDVRARIEALCRVASALLTRSAARPAAPEPDLELLPGVIGRSRAMRELAEQIRTFAVLGWRVLLLGERGTGKSLVARALHQLSGVSGEFVHADCPNLVPTLAESLLFGHEKGAFANAVQRHVGWVGRAADGTLFLDEVGDLPPEIQPKLLSLLEEGTFEPVGATRRSRFEGRVVAATNRDLDDAAQPFRRDLLDRLAQVVLRVPALRERPEDIEPLARRFFDDEVARIRALGPTPPAALSDEAVALLVAMPPAGNVRALRSLVIRGIGAAMIARSDELLPRHLDDGGARGVAAPPGGDYWDQVHEFERTLLRQALAAHGGNQTRARQALGLSNGAWDRAKKRVGL